MNLKLTIIILCGVIFGMLMTVPQFFMSDIISGGLIFGAVFAVIGWLILRHNQKKTA